LEETSEVLFHIGPLGVTGEVTTMWVIMVLLVLFSILATRQLKEKPGRLQNLAEMVVEKLHNYYAGILGKERTSKYFPLLATLFIFIICTNFSGLFPGAGTVKGFKAPTSSLSVTAGLSLLVFISLQVLGIKAHGIKGYLSHFVKPMFFMLPFLLIDEIVRPVSLALRLFGNIFGEETVTVQLYQILPIGAPLLMMVLSLLFCSIQAVVFTMLTAIYLEDATALEA
jgi:F-type H+-transporting ATPase subunit a